MFLLYLDDAGSARNASDRFVVLAGVALFERQVHFLDLQLGELAQKIASSQAEELEFHGSHMLPGKGFWRSIRDKSRRRAHIAEALATIDRLQGRRALFGATIEKAAVSPDDPLEVAFEQIVSRFDRFLDRINSGSRKERGLLILDKSTQETRLQKLARDFKLKGHTWGRTRNLVDVPFFVDSKATRAIQYADLVAYALWRKAEKGDGAFFDLIETAFDAEGGVRHGLYATR
ncbi:MAG: DUF3800 domain-containing protein [Nitratireductor sp.]|nr:DUF3800 domain-containing protein [Nitratireductor sp.]